MKKVAIISAICILFGIPAYAPISGYPKDKNGLKHIVLTDFPVSNSIEELTKESNIVVVGEFSKYVESWNMARDPKDVTKEDPNNHVKGDLYEFTVNDYLKSNGKNENKIIINITVSTNGVTDERYIEPIIGEKVVLFLKKSDLADHYYGASEPFGFSIDTTSDQNISSLASLEKVKIKTNINEIKDSFEGGKEINLSEFSNKVKNTK